MRAKHFTLCLGHQIFCFQPGSGWRINFDIMPDNAPDQAVYNFSVLWIIVHILSLFQVLEAVEEHVITIGFQDELVFGRKNARRFE